MKILVTGAAGFIGSSCAAFLRNLGHEILAVDNFSPYYSTDLKKLRVQEFLDKNSVNLLNLDLANRSAVLNLCLKENFDSVVHLAAQPGVRLPLEDYFYYDTNNLMAFSNILTASAQTNVRNFLYASSSSVYGNIESRSMSESNKCLNPVSYYGATKLSNEYLAQAVSLSTGMKTRGCRFFTVYGPWGRPDMAYFRIVSSLLNSKPFLLFGNGTKKRDFTYIDDVVKISSDLLQDLSLRDAGFSDSVNIGGGSPKSIMDVIEVLERISGRKLDIRIGEDNKSDVQETEANYTYLKSILRYRPETSLMEGLNYFFSWTIKESVVGKLPGWVDSAP